MNSTKALSTKKLFKRAVLPAAILAITVFTSWQIMATAPKANRSKPEVKIQLVDTLPVQKSDVQITVSGLGKVIPSHQITLYAEVSGRIEQTISNLVPGTRFDRNDLLAQVESSDYQILVKQQEALLAQAKADLMLEKGQQKIAQLEYKLTGNKLEPAEEALVLRKPQLASAQAEVDKAQASLDQARLNLQRTLIPAPFDGQLVSSNVNTGTLISSSTELMKIVTTDTFRIELEVPAEQLKWLEFSGTDDNVLITSPEWSGESRTGRLLAMSPQLNENSRMAKVTIVINDPLALKTENAGKPQVLINDLLRAEISGLNISNAVVVPDNLIRNGNQIWVLNNSGTLEIRSISPIFRDSDKAILANDLKDGEKIVSSYLTTPVNGLPLKSSSDKASDQKQIVAGK